MAAGAAATSGSGVAAKKPTPAAVVFGAPLTGEAAAARLAEVVAWLQAQPSAALPLSPCSATLLERPRLAALEHAARQWHAAQESATHETTLSSVIGGALLMPVTSPPAHFSAAGGLFFC